MILILLKKLQFCNGNYEKNNEKDIVVKEQNIKLIEHITIKCLSFSEMFEFKKKLLFEFVDSNNRTPMGKESFKNISIGTWFQNQKRKIFTDKDEIYIKLSQNIIVKNELNRYLNSSTFNKTLAIFLEYVNLNNKIPTCKESFKNINIGTWFRHQKSKINTDKDEIYNDFSQNIIVKEELDRYLDPNTFNKTLEIFLEYVNLNNKTPLAKESFNNVNIGSWFQYQKKKINTNEDKTYNDFSQNAIVKKELDRYLKNEKIYTFKESLVVFLEYVNLNNKTPITKESFKNINIGLWFQKQQNKIKTNKDKIYGELSRNTIVKKKLDDYLNKKNNKNNKNIV